MILGTVLMIFKHFELFFLNSMVGSWLLLF